MQSTKPPPSTLASFTKRRILPARCSEDDSGADWTVAVVLSTVVEGSPELGEDGTNVVMMRSYNVKRGSGAVQNMTVDTSIVMS